MEVVGIYGSPRKGGNTDVLLDNVLKGSQEKRNNIRKIYVRDLNISGCTGCDGCKKTGKCVIDDDMQDIYGVLDDADIVILSSPIFFYGLTSQIKALIDRAQAMWWRTRIKGKGKGNNINNKGKGYLIAAGATKGKNLFEGVQLVAKYFFDALAMSYEGGLFFRGMESLWDAKNNPEALQKAFDLGKKMVI